MSERREVVGGTRATNRIMWRRALVVIPGKGPLAAAAAALVVGACDGGVAPAAGPAASSKPAAAAAPLLDKHRQVLPVAPAHPDGPLAPELRAAVAKVVPALVAGGFPSDALRTIAGSGDARMAWYLHDLIRFVTSDTIGELYAAFEKLTGAALPPDSFGAMGDRVLAWNLPAPPGYRAMKRELYLLIEPRWAPFFDDRHSTIDWRIVGWGGVFIDDRADATRGERCARGCIPALDRPKVTDAAGGAWYPDDATVFGVVINGAARAYPKNIMEVHEMVNDTLGGRTIAIPYCTLCLSAQAYFTDDVPGFRPLMRTSGLLSRSNKFMYDLSTWSAVDTFTGRAISGPLRAAGVTLKQASVVTSSWGAWRAAHPRTTIVAEDGGIGRQYPPDPLRGRDAKGPIFPVGDVDPRLSVHEVVLGVRAADGTPVAFPRAAARLALLAGEPVTMAGIAVRADGDGLRAFIGQAETPSHEAFWFAWSQFHPKTRLWARGR